MVTEKSMIADIAAALDVEIHENDTLAATRLKILEAIDRLAFMKECREKDWNSTRKRLKMWRGSAKKNLRIIHQI